MAFLIWHGLPNMAGARDADAARAAAAAAHLALLRHATRYQPAAARHTERGVGDGRQPALHGRVRHPR